MLSFTRTLVAAIALAAAFIVPAGTALAFSPAAPAAGAVDPATIDPLLAGADIERGRDVFAKVGICVSCHGWDGNGLGKNPRSDGIAAMLRQSGLDAASFIEIISCGIPGTPMPYHDNQAYKDNRCYGMTTADFEPGQEPHKGKSIKHQDIVNLVAYIMTHIQNKPAATYADCAYYFGKTAEKNCGPLKAKQEIVDRGKAVYASEGYCVSCHGWDGNGTGKNPRAQGFAALLRETQLTPEQLKETIMCGRPGTGMPYHDMQAYTSDHCYGLTAADLETTLMPPKGRAVPEADIDALVAYIDADIKGHPKATKADCIAFFEDEKNAECAVMPE